MLIFYRNIYLFIFYYLLTNVYCLCLLNRSDFNFNGSYTIKDDKPDFNQQPTELNRIGKRYIVISKLQASWYAANEYCHRYGYHAISINSREENTALFDFLKRHESQISTFWTAGNDLAEEGIWKWFTTGQAISYTNWFHQRPMYRSLDKAERCLSGWLIDQNTEKYYNTIMWNNDKCKQKKTVICETPKI